MQTHEPIALEVTTRRFFPTDELIAVARRFASALRAGSEQLGNLHVLVEPAAGSFRAHLSHEGEAVEGNAGDPQVAVQRAFTALAERLGMAAMLPA